MSNPPRRSPGFTDTVGSFAPFRDTNGLAPPGACAEMARQEAAESLDNAAQIAAHPIDTVGETWSHTFDMEVELFRETFAAFSQDPPPGETDAQAVARHVSAVMGVVGLVEQFQYVGLAALSAPIASILPPLPCMTLTSMGLGVPHAHQHPPSFVPPAPPCPLPSLGVVTLPGSVTVLVGGLPAARAGDVGLILTCVSLGPPFEIMLGSSNTFFGGSRAARVGPDLFFHDNPGELGGIAAAFMLLGQAAAVVNAIGQASGGNFAAAGLTMAQQAADAAALVLKQMRKVDPGTPPDFGAILLGDMTVLVGGAPMPVAKSLADIIGALRGLARRAMQRRRGSGDDAATRNPDDDNSGCVGGGPCPR